MSPSSYLPSAQFMVIVGSLLLAGGTVAAAQYYVSARNAPSTISSVGTGQGSGDWTESLADIQAQSGINLPDAPDPNAVQNLLAQAQSDNLTDSIGRSILARISAAGVQGLGSDIPTQDEIVAAATAQINTSSATPLVSISSVETTPESLRTFGNQVAEVLNRHPKASFNDTVGILAKATDTRIKEPLAELAAIGREYGALARELASIPTPKTVLPLYKQAVVHYAAVEGLYPEMAKVVDDPVRGLAALQQYQQYLYEISNIFTNIAESFNKGGILFTKDEPGSAWEIFLSAS